MLNSLCRAGVLGLVLAALAAPPAAGLTPSVVGEAPNGGGVFRFPQAVAFSPGGGNVLVGDEFGGRISVFDTAGGYQSSIGSRAVRREDGRLGVVGGVATDRDRRVYVLDSENDRVQVFDQSGTHLASFGSSAEFNLMGGNPDLAAGISASGLAVAQQAPGAAVTVYVADQGNNRVARIPFDPQTRTFDPPTFSVGLGLDAPQGIALDPGAARLYVADDDNHRIVVLDPQTLTYITQVGSFGTGPGQFQNPYDVAVDAVDQLYVADNLNNRVDVFDAGSLAYVGAFGRSGRGVPGQFAIVRAVGALADDPRGGVAATDTANNRIQTFDPAGNLLAAWGIPGRGPGYVSRPRGAAFAPDGGVTVADTFDHRIERFGPDGAYAGQFGLISTSTGYATAGSNPGQFNLPRGLAYDPAGNLWAADTANDRVVELNAAGAVLDTIDGLSNPDAVAAGPAGIAIADTGHDEVLEVPTSGPRVHHTGLSAPAAVAYDGTTLYAADDAHVVNLTTGAQVPGPWDHPDGLAARDGTLYVSERRPGTPDGARVLRIPADGSPRETIAPEGAGDGQVIDPAGLALSPDGNTLLVADAGNNRVLRFDAPGVTPPRPPLLTAAVSGITRGRVLSDLPGIACATDCVQHFGAGRQVTLTAQPVAGSVLAGWGGACTGAAPTCTVTMNGDQAVAATFGPAPPPPAVAPPPPPPPAAVTITQVRLSTHRLRLARRHPPRRATRARVSLRLSLPASLTIGVEAGRPGRRRGSQCLAPTRARRRLPRCTRFVALAGRRTLAARAGAVTFTLTPRFAGRTLRPGSYRLTLTALDGNGNRVGPVRVAFRVQT